MRVTEREQALLRTLVRVAAVAALAAGVSACSSVPNWAKPNTWIGGSSASSSSVPTDSEGYPDVASVPAKPTPSTTPEERTQITNSLVADRSHAQYSADALRGGTEPAAAPPPPAAPQDLSKLDQQGASDSDNASSDAAPSDNAASDTTPGDAGPSAAPAPAAAPAEAAPAPSPGASDQQPAAAEQQAAEQPAADQPAADQPAADQPAAAPTTMVASTAPTSSYSEPAVPVVNAPGAIPGAQPGIPADAPLGFKPSSAPALDPSVAQFVPSSVLARYRATQAAAKQVAAPQQPAPAPAATTKNTKKKDKNHQAMATPEQGDVIVPAAYAPPGKPGKDGGGGSVFVNLDAANSGSNVIKTSATDGVIGSAAWRTPGLSPTGVVFFPGNSINASGMSQIRAVVDAFKARGGTGYVRVVGHSSSRTGNMPLAQHIAYVFRQSQQHATAVAEALIREGIPANAVIVEAVGDTQPVYYESMPQGEEGNRRTEIFIEG